MAKRGKKVIRRRQTGRDREDIGRILRAAGSLDEYVRWGKEEWARLGAIESFDRTILQHLALMEEVWQYQSKPLMKRHRTRPITRAELVRQTVEAMWDPLLGQSKAAVVKRILDKDRNRRRGG